MSLGKFEPSYFNSKSYQRPSSHHGSNATTTFEAKTSSQPYFNGFVPSPSGQKVKEEEVKLLDEELSEDQLKEYIHIDVHPNGGASVVRIQEDEISKLGSVSKEKLARLFFQEVFSEEPEHVAKHVIGIVHGAAKYMPELVSHFSVTRPELDIKVCMVGEFHVDVMVVESPDD